ncbi:serine/threonine protein kinase [Actinoplanes sp. LDG1-06]|uniref:Serine/threonine protein kinase n=1 Tax=Paractinoplanes ovalisporus TaxID=2810368 RepID=A0ABS2A5G6_9ACTN|nr:serine/threonine-protein kinase [Actinoplanes ovalisporus]MBM2615088.1 serine/threonine protein kinase [Actinoplanes ovalisporus]
MPLLAGRYRVGAQIGHGGTSAVHRGFDRSLRRPVAIKMIHGSAASGLATPLDEARAAALLNHPNVARVLDFGEAVTGAPFLVMEYVPGGTLADRLKGDGPMPPAEAAAIAADVAAALAAAHARGIVHRDIKPKNVMLGPTGAKLVDFGVAAPVGEKPVDAGGRVWGTPAYSAPEQLQGQQSHPPADVYALGVLLHECLTGAPPWQGATPEQILIDRHLRPMPTFPDQHAFPAAVVDLHQLLLSSRPSRRPTATEAARVLREFAAGRYPQRRPKPVTRPQVLAAACVAAAVTLLGAVIAHQAPAGPGEAGPTHPSVAATADLSTPPPDTEA